MEIWVQLAAGSGERMQTTTPKQFLRLGNRPLFLHSIETFLRAFPEGVVVCALPLAHLSRGRKLLHQAFPEATIHAIVGGPSRSASTEAVLHFLKENDFLDGESIVAFHDAARPFVSESLIERIFATAQAKGNAICGLPIAFSVREVEGEHSRALPRQRFWEVQTPQAFRSSLLLQAWQRLSPTANAAFTDEASWMEAAGIPIHLVPGEPSNLKITYPIDWETARAWLRRRSR
ncbi:MAG: IspD/TarI family cytidylyltransferase [Bacteroidia bacterium]|nr:IspD/TarI family cytidylyltransferase [Bacteroidia bacterium]